MNFANAEIQKNIWLEFSWHRFIGTVILLALFIMISQNQFNPDRALSYLTSCFFIITVVGWGSYRAANAVLEEAQNHTWDKQRLSSLSSWQLTNGKLFGSTLFNWLVGFMALAVNIYASLQYLPAKQVLYNSLFLILAGVGGHSFALITSLGALTRSESRQSKPGPIGFFFLGAGFAYFFITHTQSTIQKSIPSVMWYLHPYATDLFTLAFGSIFILWMYLGINWCFRAELKMKVGIALWSGFVLFCTASAAGFGNNAATSIDLAYNTVLFILYCAAFLAAWSGESYRRFILYRKRPNNRLAGNYFPAWLIPFVLLMPICIAKAMDTEHTGLLMCLSGLMLTVRDIALLHCFKLNPRSRRPVSATVFYLFLLNIMLPILLGSLNLKDYMIVISHVFVNTNLDTSQSIQVIALIASALQAIAVCYWAWCVWNKYWVRKQQAF